MSVKIKRSVYADMFGPTTGDKVRLADTDLIIEVEKDFTVYGDEVKFGGGKVIRDGMGQSQRACADAMDTVITNAVILDHWGIVKADVGIKDGHIAAIGKAGNPDIQPSVTIVIGPGTEAIAGEGKIVTAGGIDAHNHLSCPQQIEDALYAGMFGPTTGDRPIQVGSHYHFFETNPALKFDRKKARGMRLDIAAGTAVRFEPGQTREVQLVALAGKKTIYGFRGDVMGKL